MPYKPGYRITMFVRIPSVTIFLVVASIGASNDIPPTPAVVIGQEFSAPPQSSHSPVPTAATSATPAKSPIRVSPIATAASTNRPASATPSATPPDPLASNVEAGRIFSEANNFDKASEAFSRALQSKNAETRHAALTALQKLENKRSGRFRWFFSLAGAWIPTAITTASAVLFLIVLWLSLGPIGRFFGRDRIKISGVQGSEGEEAAMFRVALLAAIAERKEGLGPLSGSPNTPWIVFSISEIFDLLPEVSEGPAAKIFAILLKRTVIPEFDARVWSSGERKEILTVSLSRNNRLCHIWREFAAEKDNFLANMRAARNVITYLTEVR